MSRLKVPIFYYHSIGNQGPETLPSREFRLHLELIRDRGFTPVTFSELLTLPLDAEGDYVVLSFDDGLLDNYENAAPMLDEFGYKATFFVIPGFDDVVRWVNPKTGQWSDSEKSGFTLPFPSMNRQHRRQLHDAGMEIGCHTMNHPKLNDIPRERLANEIRQPKSLLEDQLGSDVRTFCYPKGRYNKAVLEEVATAGYLGACTTMPAYYDWKTQKLECGRFLVEDHRLFGKILEWAAPDHPWTQPLCTALRVPLKLKNTLF